MINDILRHFLGKKKPSTDRETYKTEIVPPAAAPPQEYDVAAEAQAYQSPSQPDQMAVRPSQAVGDRISAIASKDYSITKDPEGNVISRGKDRDAKWSVKDKVGSAAMGALEGLMRGGPLGALAGGLGAGMDRNYLEKREDSKELAYLKPRHEMMVKQEDADQDYRKGEIDISNAAMRPQFEQQRIDIAATKAENAALDQDRIYQLKVRTQDWKEKDRAEYMQLEKDKFKALKDNRQDLYQLAVRRQGELERHNKATEMQAGKNEQGRMTRQQITLEAQRTAAALKEANAKGRQEEAQKHRERLLELKNQYSTTP